MKINPEMVDMLIPEGFPPDRFVPPAVRLAGQALGLESQVPLRSYLWASALVQAGFESDIQLPPDLSHISQVSLGSTTSHRFRRPCAVRWQTASRSS